MHPQEGTAAALAHVTAGDIMTSPVITVRADASTQHVAETLTQHRISAAPVVNEAGTLVGLVSEYDLLAKTGGVARDLMTTAVISVTVRLAPPTISGTS